MPLDNERAARLAHVSLARQRHVAEAIARWKTLTPSMKYADDIRDMTRPVDEVAVELGDVGYFAREMEHCLAIDGSIDEVLLPDGSMIGFVVAAAALTDIVKYHGSQVGRFVDARALSAATTRFAVEAALPSAFKAATGLTSVATWRMAVNDMLDLPVDGHDSPFTLGAALRLLHGSETAPVPLRGCFDCGYQPRVDLTGNLGAAAPSAAVSSGYAAAPTAVIADDPVIVHHPSAGQPSACPRCGARLLLGDALHTHPEFNEEAENSGALSRLMLLAERLMMVGHIESTLRADPRLLSRVLLVTDGPLAIFGSRSGSLTPLFSKYLARVNTTLAEHGNPPLQYVGVEKHGAFAEHARLISDLIAPGHVMLPSISYIQRHIVHRVDDHNVYGKHEFFGRRFFYRTTGGAMLVLTVPPKPGITPYSKDPASEQWTSYPTLSAVIRHLESMTSRLYTNAVLPLMTAHANASLPQGTGRSVLTALASGASMRESVAPKPNAAEF